MLLVSYFFIPREIACGEMDSIAQAKGDKFFAIGFAWAVAASFPMTNHLAMLAVTACFGDIGGGKAGFSEKGNCVHVVTVTHRYRQRKPFGNPL